MQAVCGQSMRDARKDSYRRLEKLITNLRVWRAEIVVLVPHKSRMYSRYSAFRRLSTGLGVQGFRGLRF